MSSNKSTGPGLGRIARLLAGGEPVQPEPVPLRDLRFRCPKCNSLGFMPSVLGICFGCTLCDGTVNGEEHEGGTWKRLSDDTEWTILSTAVSAEDGQALVVYGRHGDLGDVEVWAEAYLKFFTGGLFERVA